MAKEKKSPHDLLSTTQAAAELGVSIRRVNVFVSSGRLPAQRIGWAWIIRRGDLDALEIHKRGRPRKKPAEKTKKA